MWLRAPATGLLSHSFSHSLFFLRNVWLLINPELPSRFRLNILGLCYRRYKIRILDKKPLIAHTRLLIEAQHEDDGDNDEEKEEDKDKDKDKYDHDDDNKNDNDNDTTQQPTRKRQG